MFSGDCHNGELILGVDRFWGLMDAPGGYSLGGVNGSLELIWGKRSLSGHSVVNF